MTFLSTIRANICEYTSDTLKEKIDVIVTSPPYKMKDGYTPMLMHCLGRVAAKVLKPGGRMFLNFGQLREGFQRPFEAAMQAHSGTHFQLNWGQTIAWVKSIAIDGHQTGHFQPINSDKILNYCWEPIFTFYKPPEKPLDRLSIGVPYADKSNLKRGTRGKNGDLHCGGDVWYIPYETTGSKTKKKHRHEYPEELVRRCLLVSGVGKDATVLEPFCGSGTTAAVAKSLGMNAVVIDRDSEALATAQSRWDETESNHE